MIASIQRVVQAGFIAGLLVAGVAHAQAAAKPATTTGKPAPTAVDTSGPSQLIESSANILLSGIDSRRAEFRKDPTSLYQPGGATCRRASDEQRKGFVEAFYNSLLYAYGDAMVDGTADRLKVFPTKADAA